MPIEVPSAAMERALRDAGIVFMFAPLMHPAMRHVGPGAARAGHPDGDEHGRPAGQPGACRRQVSGWPTARLASWPARSRSWTVHAMVVHGEPGMDEVSPLGPTDVVEIRDGTSREWTIDPTRFGFGKVGPTTSPAVRQRQRANRPGGACAATGPAGVAAAVVLNAAAAIYVSGMVASYEEGVEAPRRRARGRQRDRRARSAANGASRADAHTLSTGAARRRRRPGS